MDMKLLCCCHRRRSVSESVRVAEQVSDGAGSAAACHLASSTVDGSQPNWFDSPICIQIASFDVLHLDQVPGFSRDDLPFLSLHHSSLSTASSAFVDSPLSPFITSSHCHFCLKSHLFHKSFSAQTLPVSRLPDLDQIF